MVISGINLLEKGLMVLHIQTERLTIVVFTVEMMEAALIGNVHLEKVLKCKVPVEYPLPEYKELLPYKMKRFSEHPEEGQWEGVIIHTLKQTVIGNMGFKGGPDEKGEMDLGYSILPAFRRNGYATEMATAMV